MKYLNRLAFTGIVLLSMFVLFSGCKKDEEDPIPTFTLTYDSVALTTGGKGLQFYAKCNNTGVTMGKVTITNPASGIYIYDAKGASYEQNYVFPLQTTGQAYLKQTGTWSFNLTGATSGGTAFVLNADLAVSN